MAIQTIPSTLIADNAISAAKIASGIISADDIADNSLTAAKISASTSPTFGGLDVTGTVTADGFSNTGTASFNTTGGTQIQINDTDGSNQWLRIAETTGQAIFDARNGASNGEFLFRGFGGGSASEHMRIDASGNVGIGTNNPSGSKLQVQADGIAIKLDGTADTTRTLFFRNTTSSNPAQIYSDGSLRLRTEDASTNITFHTNSTGTDNERMRIDSSGNVGIGTSPSRKLHVNSGIDGISAGIAGTTYGIRFDNGGAFSSGMSTIHGVDASLTSSYQPIRLNGSDVRFATSNNERMRIDSSGNVGIGTTNPGVALQVHDSLGTTLEDGVLRLIDDTSYAQNVGAAIALGFKYNSSGNVLQRGGVIKAIKENATDGNYASALLFGTTANGASTTERMRIDSSGNVGIGTGSPNANAKLDVNGVIRLYNASSDPTAVAGGLYYNTTDAQVKVSNGTTWAAIGASVLPTSVSNLYSWWDFSGTYSTIGSGNSTVTDASGNGYTLTESGTVTTESFPSGRSGMRTGASNAANYFSSSAIPASGGAARTLFAIFYNLKNTGVAYQHIMHYGSTVSNQAFGAAYTSGGAINQHLWSGTGASISYTQGRTGSTGVAVIFSVYDGNNTGKVRLYDAGSTTGSNSTATYSANTGTGYGIQVGGRIANSEYGDVVIGECGAYSKALSDVEMDKIAVGLLNRWI